MLVHDDGKSIKTATNETSDKQLESGHGQNVALLETPNGITLLGASKMREANGNGHGHNHERFSVERRPQATNDEDDSFEYATDRESSGVYNPTTIPMRNVLMGQAAGRNSQPKQTETATETATETESTNTENSDLLQRGNELGIPESRFSRWLPKDQRELLQKQANLLSGRSQAAAKPTPPAAPPKPIKNPQVATPATTTPTTTPTTTTTATPKLPQETEI
ncbi:hypothetical protein ACLKA6_000874 [Drosophila palustris]